MIWRLTYCNKKGVEARVDIIKGDRTSVEIVKGSANPFAISYKLDKNDKSGHIMTSSADIEIFETETFNIDDLKTSNETELKVEYFEGNILTWTGFILPDFFSREIGSPNIVRMTASDRLTALKGVTLSDLPIRISLRDLIELCLEQTGLSLALVAQVQINQGSTNILDTEILSQRLTDTRGRSISCYDILMSIMVATNSTIRQRKGQWVVYNKLEHELRAPTIFFDKVERGAIRTIQPVASSVGVYQEFGGNRLHPNNYDFSNGLTNWTPRNGFEAYIDNKVVSYFLGGTPIYQPDVTTNDYLVNFNNWITNETNLDTAPFLESNNIPIASTQSNTVEVEVDISAVMAEKLSSNTTISFLRYAIIATNGVDTYALTTNGVFETYDPEKINEHSIILAGGQQPPLLLTSPAYTNSSKRKGVLEVNNVNDFHINIRIYGSGFEQYVNVNFASVRFSNKTETPKGNLYKTIQGSNYTKLHDVETVIFGDYIRKGLNGYFYDYPVDETSNLYLPNGELAPPTWITIFDTTEQPLLHHISRQKSRLFSVAHDILRANINVESFDPLAVFQDCKGSKYVVVSANFDFLRSEVDAELEQIVYDNTILKRDFIYSYFGEGESNIKSIGGIAGGGGGSGGGLTPGQIEVIGGIKEKVDEVEERINNSRVGVANLLRNTGFLGDFQPLNVDYRTVLENGSPVDTNPLKFWTHSNTSVIDAPSRSGKGVRIGSIQQNVVLKIGEPYVLSFWARGTSLIVELVDTIEIPLTSEYKRYSFDVIAPETKEYTFSLIDGSNMAEVYEIMLSNGNTKVGYAYAEEDDVKTISQVQAINTILNAIKTGKTEILGGLILSTMIQLGKYKDDVMEKVTSGINGIYNNDEDPAIWAGGSFDDAIRTVQKFIDNPNYEPTEAEWAEMANIVFTHGGDGFFRGYIYALGGIFRGKIESNFNGNKIVIDPEDRSLKMFNSNGWLSLSMTFSQSEVGSHNDAKINVYTYKENGEVLQNTQISPGGVSVLSQNEIDGVWITDMTSIYLGGLQVLGYQSDGVDFTKNYEFSIHRNTITPGLDMEITTVGLPTTGEGLPNGMWYIENGFLKVKQ